MALLLHGFPDTPYTWQNLMPQLAQRGYRVFAPFMRGYAPTDTAVTYQVGALVKDVNALHDALGGKFGIGVTKDIVIGHDWGAVAALGSDVSSDFVPSEFGKVRWAKVVSLAIPPASGLFATAAVQGGDYSQIKKSFYIWFFGHSVDSNPAFAANSFSFIDQIWKDWSSLDLDTSFYAAAAKAALNLPANYTGALDYYRATVWGLSGIPIYPNLDPNLLAYDLAGLGTNGVQPLFPKRPTLFLYGTNDQVFDQSVMGQASEAATAASPVFRSAMIQGANHFLHLERPNLVNGLLLAFLQE
jgi:pimeloyl-ACP methyl ester carboxylesterase